MTVREVFKVYEETEHTDMVITCIEVGQGEYVFGVSVIPTKAVNRWEFIKEAGRKLVEVAEHGQARERGLQ